MNDEIWKPVVGFEQSYIISNKGRVKSLHKGVMLAYMASVNSLSVRLFDNRTGNKYRKSIAELVLEAFVEPSNGRMPKYLDGNAKNCNLENLCWDNNSVKKNHARGYTVSKYINILCYYEGNIVGAFKSTGDINKFLKDNNINSRTDNLTRAIRLKTTYKCMEYKIVDDDEFNSIKVDNSFYSFHKCMHLILRHSPLTIITPFTLYNKKLLLLFIKIFNNIA